MTVELENLDPDVGGWFGTRGWDHEFCRAGNHINPPEGELCHGCYHPIGATASGYALFIETGAGVRFDCWIYWHHDCYWEHVEEKDATGLVLDRLDGDYDPW